MLCEQVASWGGYTFIINLLPIHCLACIFTGQLTAKLYIAFAPLILIGTIEAGASTCWWALHAVAALCGGRLTDVAGDVVWQQSGLPLVRDTEQQGCSEGGVWSAAAAWQAHIGLYSAACNQSRKSVLARTAPVLSATVQACLSLQIRAYTQRHSVICLDICTLFCMTT